jgi:hypothetical protein
MLRTIANNKALAAFRRAAAPCECRRVRPKSSPDIHSSFDPKTRHFAAAISPVSLVVLAQD